jgi:Ran GTPase-activating protein (RanGAP) involved in mRNA processing and transport
VIIKKNKAHRVVLSLRSAVRTLDVVLDHHKTGEEGELMLPAGEPSPRFALVSNQAHIDGVTESVVEKAGLLVKDQLRDGLSIQQYLEFKGISLNKGLDVLESECMLPNHFLLREELSAKQHSQPRVSTHEQSACFKLGKTGQLWACLECGQRGDIFDLVMKYEKIPFYRAIEVVAFLVMSFGGDVEQLLIKCNLKPDPQQEKVVEVKVIQDPTLMYSRELANHTAGPSILDDVDTQQLSVAQQYIADCRRLNLVPLSKLKREAIDELSCTELNLSSLIIRPRDLVPLRKVFASLSELTSINLCDNQLGDNGLVAFVRALAGHTNVRTLVLSKNSIGYVGVAALARALLNSNAQDTLRLQELDLGNNMIGSAQPSRFAKPLDEDALHLAEASGDEDSSDEDELDEDDYAPRRRGKLHPSELLEAETDGTPLQYGACVLAYALGRNSSVTSLSLHRNHINHTGAVSLAAMIESNSCLDVLDLSWNEFGPIGAQAIANGIRENQFIKTMNLAFCGFGDEGVSHICDSWSSNLSLTWLDLSNNHLTEVGAYAIANGIRATHTIKSLGLNYNQFGMNGGRAILEAIKDNESVEHLALEGSTCLGNSIADIISANDVSFDADKPAGHYMLDLAKPIHRTIAINLIKLEEDEEGRNWQNARLNGEHIILFETPKTAQWPQQLPRSGTLELDYISTQSILDPSILDRRDFALILAELGNPRISDYERLNLLRILARATFFTCEQIHEMLKKFVWTHARVEVVVLLFSKCIDPRNMPSLTRSMLPSEQASVKLRLGWLYAMHPNNPTGLYELHLTQHVDRCIAHQLLLTTKKNQESRWRNLTYEMQPYKFDLWDWKVPDTGVIRVSFVAGQGVMHDEPPLENDVFSDMLHDFKNVANEKDRLMLVSWNANYCRFTVDQLLDMVLVFENPAYRATCVVRCFKQTVDREQNMFKIMQHPLLNSSRNLIAEQLGWRNLIDLEHPEGSYELQLHDPEEKDIVYQLHVKANELDGVNWKDITLNHQPLRWTEKSVWESMANEGTLRFVFISGQEAKQQSIKNTANKDK